MKFVIGASRDFRRNVQSVEYFGASAFRRVAGFRIAGKCAGPARLGRGQKRVRLFAAGGSGGAKPGFDLLYALKVTFRRPRKLRAPSIRHSLHAEWGVFFL